MKNYTDITVLLDRSGSMNTLKSDMEGGFAEFVKAHQATPSTKLTLIQFDHIDPQHIVYEALPINDVPPFILEPRGGTPLLDAWKRAIDRTGQRLASMKAEDRPRGVLFVVITDGEENASHIYTRREVFASITHQEKKYAWEFIYLGANQDAIGEAASFGISVTKGFDFKASGIGTRSAYTATATNTAAYAAGTASGLGAAENASFLNFSAQQRAAAADDDPELLKKAAGVPVTFGTTTTTP
jgi:hypothetical protein